MTNRKPLFSVQGPDGSLCFTPDGKRLAIAAYNPAESIIVEVDTGKQILTLKASAVHDLAFNRDGTRLAVVGTGVGNPPLAIWDADAGEKLWSKELALGLRAVAYSPNGKILATADVAGHVALWDATSGDKISERTLTGPPRRLAFAPDGRHLLTGNGNGTVYVFRLAELNP